MEEREVKRKKKRGEEAGVQEVRWRVVELLYILSRFE